MVGVAWIEVKSGNCGGGWWEWDQATRWCFDPRDLGGVSSPIFLGRDFPGDQPISPGGVVSWVWTPGILAGLPTEAVMGREVNLQEGFLFSYQAGLLTPEPL